MTNQRKKKLNVSGGALSESVTINVTFDFSNCTNEQLIDWALSERTIALQRALRSTDSKTVESMDGQTIHAESAGTKPQSREQQIRKLTDAGINRELAEVIVDNPDRANELLNK